MTNRAGAMLLVLSLAVTGVAPLRGQGAPRPTGVVAGVVTAHEGGAPLPNTMVSLPAFGRERFSSTSGTFSFADVPAGRVNLRVRRLGYAPAELSIAVRANAIDTVRVVLRRLAVQLSSVDVRALPPCFNPGAPHPSRDSTLSTIYEQLLLNAEQFRLLSREYPFSTVLVSTISNHTRDGETIVAEVDTLRVRGDGGWKYQPGKVLALERRSHGRAKVMFLIPTLENFADPEFAGSHCFHYRGLAGIGDSSFVRIDLVAAQNLRTTDVDGSIYLDPGSFQIRRAVLTLTRIPVPGLTSVEVITDFRELLPSIPVIGRVVSTQVLDPRRRGYVSAREEKQLTEITFLGQRPGEDRKP